MSRSFTGQVVSTKMSKTIVVEIRRAKAHPLYHKATTQTARFQAHDETNEAKLGDRVEIIETRPISRRKHFKLVRIIEKATELEAAAVADKEAGV